jgi:hypothetical protein
MTLSMVISCPPGGPRWLSTSSATHPSSCSFHRGTVKVLRQRSTRLTLACSTDAASLSHKRSTFRARRDI